MKFAYLTVSNRRKLLDQHLQEIAQTLHGRVIDLGGENKRRRGVFRPANFAHLDWVCVNIDATEAPEIVADVTAVPLVANCADVVVCTEVIEHVRCPEKLVAEAQRILRPDGIFILSIPFLYEEHADPFDFQRYTSTKLRLLLSENHFSQIQVQAQGYYFTVLTDLLRVGLNQIRLRPLRWLFAAILYPLMQLFLYLDKRPFVTHHPKLSKFSTGYFVTAVKPHI